MDDEITTVKVASDVTVNGMPFVPVLGDSYSKTVKDNLNGLYKSYSVDKHGIITDLKIYGTADTFNGEKGYLIDNGIDKVSKEYTVLVGASKQAITCDDDATYFYVDEDGNISESSYKAIAQDGNDKVYLYAKDYMVQTLFVEEVPAPKTTYGVNFTGSNFTVNGAAPAFIEADEKGDDVEFTVEAAAGYQIDSVKVGTKTLTADKNGVYTVENVKSTVTVTVATSAVRAETMDIVVNYVLSNGTVIEAGVPTAMPADTDKSYVTVTATAPEGYKLVGVAAQYVPFEANGMKTVEFTVAAMDMNDVQNALNDANVTEVVVDDLTLTDDLDIPAGKALVINDTLDLDGHNIWAAGDLTINDEKIVGGSDAYFTVGAGAEVQVFGNQYIMRVTNKTEDDDTANGVVTLNKDLSGVVLGVKNGVDLQLASGVKLNLSGLEIRTNAKISNVASATGVTATDNTVVGYIDVNSTVTISAN